MCALMPYMHSQLCHGIVIMGGLCVVVFRWLSNEVDKNKWSFTSSRVLFLQLGTPKPYS